MAYNLFVDDDRDPNLVANYINPVDIQTFYRNQEFIVARSYPEMLEVVEKHGLPSFVSMDHDLAPHMWESNLVNGEIDYGADAFKNIDNRTGYHCILFLLSKFVLLPGKDLCKVLVHSQNLKGKDNIEELIIEYNNEPTMEKKLMSLMVVMYLFGMQAEAKVMMKAYKQL